MRERNEKMEVSVKAMLLAVRTELDRLWWNKYQREMDSPFDNSGVGSEYHNDYLTVRPYDWSSDEDDKPNFETKELKIWWYKHYRRCVHYAFTDEESFETLATVLYNSLESIRKDLETE